MKDTAAGLAALGRYGDSTLVHMSPREVAGLQALAKANGTSLTVNPHTGLPEAFKLDAFLPAIAGVALSPFVGPLAAGLIVGGLHGVATDFRNPLQSVMAGVGGAGGAGLGGALGAAGTAAGTASAAAPVAETAANVLTPAVESATSGAISGFPSSMSGIDAANAMAGDTAAQAAIDAANPAFAGNPAATMRMPTSFDLMGKGISGMMSGGTEGEAARSAFMGNVDGFSGLVKTGGMAAAPMMSEAMNQEQTGGIKPISTIRPYDFQRTLTPGAFDDVTDSRERRYFEDKFTAKEPYQLARGGLAAFARGGKAKKPDPLEQRYEMADFRDPQAMQKKTMGMYQYAVGGKAVSGPGDGMSDNVKANIDGVREARLSDGEFVIPADVVSGLGNGSTDAGAKQLREMMDRVRQTRTGRKQQARQIKVKGLMPA